MVVAFLQPRMTSGLTSGAAAEYGEREILRFKREFARTVKAFVICPCPIDIFVYYLPLEHY